MSKSEVNGPVSSAPINRLALGVGWVRPGVAGIGGTLTPSFLGGGTAVYCFFEGTDE